jgi:probable FeS assembly SUF system protein SufT
MSRDTEVTLNRDCRAQQVPQGAPTTLPAGTPVTIVQSLGDWHTVMTERRQLLRIAAEDSDALGVKPPQRLSPGASAFERGSLEQRCLELLESCYDPEFPVNVVDLGLVYVCQVTPRADGGHEVLVLMTLTTPGCGMGDVIRQEVEDKLAELPGVERVRVEIVFDPPWDPSRMTEAARLQLGLL